MKDKTKILWIGDGGCATGFARVNHSIISNLPERFEVHHLALNYMGDPYPGATHAMYPAILGGDYLGVRRIQKLIETVKPDLIFILNDPWVVYEYLKVIQKDKKVIVYMPIDAKPIDMEWVLGIAPVNQMVAYTEFGKSAFMDQIPLLGNKMQVIPHGTDTSIFQPMDMIEARKSVGLPEDNFIIFNGNRNQPRKRLDLTLKGFAKFAEDKEDVYLYLHTGIEDAGWNIIKLAHNYGIGKKIIITSKDVSPQNYVSDELLNKIYNAANVGLNTSMGEGWGLVSVEQACCKRAQIVPNSSACAEIFPEGRGLRIDINTYAPHLNILTEGAIVSVESIAEKLDEYYYDRELMKEHAENAYDFFTDKSMTWENITNKYWIPLFDRVIKESPRPLEMEKEGTNYVI